MDLIKDVENLSKKIDELKSGIERYDHAFRSVDKHNIDKVFGSYKAAQAGAMSVDKLAQAVGVLSNQYGELVSAQEAAKNKMQQMTLAMTQMEQLQKTISAAQREALSSGDQAGATELYKQYVATGESMQLLRMEIESTGAEITSLDSKMAQHTQTMERYKSVNDAAQSTKGNENIADLTNKFETEKNKIKEVSKSLEDYKIKYDATKAVVEQGGLVVGGLEKSKADLQMYADEITRLSNEYVIAAERAQQYATALGNDESGIPKVEMPEVEPEKVKQAAESMKEYAEHAGDADDKLKEVVKAGAMLGSLTYGAHKLKELAQQVMNTRSEFQQLEVAFTTMLGNKGKAEALMQQLTKTAATTPFDLQSVSRGAKQLLAYGTAADDVNDILVHLGDIAAGLSQPLDALVYLYGTTMVQGRMMTMDLRQFQNRGIPIAEQLAKQFGVAKSEVQSLVSAGRVTSEEFHKAVMAMSSDGGKFAGLMSNQSKTIGGQISNIQDSIDMMFNEIGKNSEGIINVGLEGVSKIVENYETVGKVILDVVAVYGSYKAALIVTSAIEAARAKQTTFTVSMAGKQLQLTNLLTKATWKQIAAQLKANAAAYANPYVAVAAAIAGLIAAIITVTRLQEKNIDIVGRANKKYEERTEKIQNEQDALENYVKVLEDEASSYYEILQARDALSKMDAFKGKNIAGMTPEQIREEFAKWKQEEQSKATEEQLNAYKEAAGNTGAHNYQRAITEGGRKKALENAEEAVKAITENRLEGIANKSIDERREKIKEWQEANKKDIAWLNKQSELWYNSSTKKRVEEWGADAKHLDYGKMYAFKLKVATMYAKNFEQQLENLNETEKRIAEEHKEENTGNSLYELIYGYNITGNDGKKTFVNGILQQEKLVDEARKKYAGKNSQANKKNLESAENALKELTEKYNKATGLTWTSTKEMTKQTAKEIREAARQQIDIQQKEYSKRVQLAEKYKRDSEDIDLEEAEWKEKNPNRPVPVSFAKRKAVVDVQYKFDKEQLDEEFNDWIEGIQRETVQINTEVEISELERAIDLADDYNTKLEKREEINKKQIAIKNAELDLEKEQTAKEKFGEKTIEKYNQLKGGKISQDALSDEEKVVFAQLERFYTEFENKRNAIMGQMQHEHSMDILQEDLSDYEEYCNEIIAAAQEREDAIAAIRNGQETNRTLDMVEKDYQARVKKAGEDHGIDAAEKNATDIVARLVNSLADVTYDQVETAANKFYHELKEQEEMLSKIKGMSAEQKAAEVNTTQADIDRLKLEADNPLLSDEQKAAILDELAEKEQYLVYLKSTEVELDNHSVKLVETRKNIEGVVANAKLNSGKKTQEQLKKENKQYSIIIQSLELVRDTANAVADTFGGALSKKGKKALETISQVADFGISAVQGIATTVKGVQDAMTAAGVTAISQLSALEKASVILTIISVAVQLIMKIVEIASQFTKSAQLQEAIDEHLAKVDELQKRQQLIESQYATSQGSDYYKGLVKSGKEYKKIINETKKALEDAEALYYHNKNKYGEDSDKTKDAKAKWEDIQQQDQDNINAEIEHWRSLMEEISGTSLDSFAENLADALIEGFAEGKEGINDVWEDTMDDLLRTMMRNQLATALKDQFKDAFTSLENATKNDGVLSEDEMNAFMDNLEKGKETAEQIASAYYDAMSEAGLLDDADAEGSEGFGQMTQDQADTLTARFTAVQIEMSNVSAATQAMAGVVAGVSEDIKLGVAGIQSLLYNSNIALQMAQDQLDHLQVIADNTAMLTETNNRLRAIEQNTGRL